MRVQLCIADEAGCGFYRMEEPARVARLEGTDAQTVTEFASEVGFHGQGEGLIYRLPKDLEIDVIVLQRPASKQLLHYIPEFQRQGIAVVVEVDDDLSRLQPQHVSRAGYLGRLDPTVHWRNLAKACMMADLVTVTTPPLAERFGSHGRVIILPNCVPEAVCDLPRESDGATLGWTGAVRFHPGDLQVTYGGVQQALDLHPEWRFLKIGGGAEIVQRGLDLKERPDETGPLPISRYHAALSMLDIGIAPLSENGFNEAKSYLKALEYAGAGIPFLASPMPDYEYLHDEFGLGALVKSRSRSWRARLHELMENEALRSEMAAEGRSIVREYHTYEGNAWRWIEAWEQAMTNRQGRRPAELRAA